MDACRVGFYNTNAERAANVRVSDAIIRLLVRRKDQEMSINIPRLLAKTFLLLALSMSAATAAQAYTIVLRSGERVEIPDRFRITETTLTYEVAQTITRTILLNSIDLDATERVNNEPSGGLRRRIIDDARRETRAAAVARPADAQQPRSNDSTARPTLTNDDLAGLRQRGAKRMQAYELQRQTLPAASAEQTAEENARLSELARKLEAERSARESDAEDFYAAQACALRFEFAEVNTELRYWRARLAEATGSSLTSLATPATTLIGVPPIAYPYNFGGISAGTIFALPHIYQQGGVVGTGGVSTTTTRRDTSSGIQIGIGGRRRGGIAINGGYARRDVRSSQVIRGAGNYGYVPPFGYPAGVYGFGGVGSFNIGLGEIAQLRDRIRELEAARARLIARERLLEDEARRAGIAPGVLRQ